MIIPTLIQSIFIAVAVAVSVGMGASVYVLRGTSSVVVLEDTTHQIGFVETTLGGLPHRLNIPSLKIDAVIETVGRTPEGAMESPSNFRDVAWYKNGAQPGQVGSAVIAGHLDNAFGIPGVFKNLKTLTVGGYVYVENTSGEEIRFRVLRVATYPYDEVPTRELFDRGGGVYLNLITCAGAWLWKDKTYDQRFIVYTEYAPEE